MLGRLPQGKVAARHQRYYRDTGVAQSCPFCACTSFDASSLTESHLSARQVALARIGSQRNQNSSVLRSTEHDARKLTLL